MQPGLRPRGHQEATKGGGSMASPRPRPSLGRHSASGRRTVSGVLALVLTGVLAACSVGGDPDDGAAAGPGSTAVHTAVAPEADCLAPQVLTALGFDPDAYTGAVVHPDVPDPVPVPEDFTAVSAVMCSTGETLTDDSGRWAAVTARRLEGDVGPLVRVLTGLATLPATGTKPTACPRESTRTDLWLVDALGDALRVLLPGRGCGTLPSGVADGLAALDTMDVEHYPVELVAPRPGSSSTTG